ncbi:MAG TPA: PSD1 and planctomycete cytochrome C domain-containing protein [Planctomycetota bacterium]|nr:PSD1 and planctomycete cytochrome C domain-containing protein [Planctomycetota bacterium]
MLSENRTLWLILCSFSLIASVSAGEVDFVRDIQPIFKAACYSCHGPEKQKGELRMDSRELALKGGSSGVMIKPGNSKDSLLMHRILGLGDEPRMPVKADALTKQQVELIAAWIDQGAKWPESASVAAQLKKHWAYVKPVRPEIPKVQDSAWVRNPIDAFILARLESEKLKPSPEADKTTLIRRLSLDLVGLPPTLQEIDAFLADTSPDAYEKQVERLLSSPQFGERWARPWLDLARYADTNGFNFDNPRQIWKFRDWVIDALNKDMPFDQFTLEQLAGDMLPGATQDQKIATGFHRNTMLNEEGGVDAEEARWETLLDRVHTTATVWMGSTMGCAQCHNHKFDPFRQKEFYQFLAFFDNSDEPLLRMPRPNKEAELKQVVEEIVAVDKQLKENKNDKELKKRFEDLKKKRAELEITTLVLQERANSTPATDFRIKGSYVNKGERVQADTPAFLSPRKADQPANRLGLAKWLIDPDNPLTARVTVNRFWETLFMRGLVETSEDFGTQGTPPTHPELVDYLATEFVAKKWSVKTLLRAIVTSATYRQSSKITREMLQRDPANKLLARAPRYRMEAEMIRDSILAASGQLSLKMFGPPVFPPAPELKGIVTTNKSSISWTVSKGEDRFRRSVYTYWRRTNPFATFVTFDATSREFCTVKRSRSNTPLQALNALNDAGLFDAARALAARMSAECTSMSADARLAYGFRLCTGRHPRSDELQAFSQAFEKELAHFSSDAAAAKSVIKGGTVPLPPKLQEPEFAALTMIANAMLNLDETISRE